MGVLFKNVSLQGNQLSIELFLSKTIFLSPHPVSASSYLNRSVSLAVCFNGFLADVQTTIWAPDTQCPLLQIFNSCLSLTSVCHSAFKINNICNFMVFAAYRISECLPALYIIFLNCWCSLYGINRLSRGHNLLSVWDFRSIKSPSVPTRALRIATQTPATHPPTHPTTHLCKAHMLAHKLKDQLERDMGQLFTGLTVCCHIILLAGSA